MKMVQIRYFASLREQAGIPREQLETAVVTLGELYDELRHRYDFSLSRDAVKVAVDEEYRSMDYVIAGGEEAVVIHPDQPCFLIHMHVGRGNVGV